MKKIILTEMDIKDFRGRTTSIKFGTGVNRFSGKNGTGKTTLFDAHTWGFFGKNSLGKTKFDIKTLRLGKPVSGSLHSVENSYTVNGECHSFKRTYKEVWQKLRNSLNPVKTGNTTDYRIDGKKGTKKAYDNTVNELLQPTDYIDTGINQTEIYKIVTDPRYFANLPWETRRTILGKMDGVDVDTTAIIYDLGLSPHLLKSKTEDGIIIEYTVEEKQKIFSDRQKEINGELASFKSKIEEHQTILDNSAEHPRKISLSEAKKAVVFAGNFVDQAQNRINEFKTGSNPDLIENLRNLNHDLVQKEHEFSDKKRIAQKVETNRSILIEKKLSEHAGLTDALERQAKSLTDIRREYIDAKEQLDYLRGIDIPDDETVCYNCGGQLPEKMIAESRNKFNLKRSNDLEKANEDLKRIVERGESIKAQRDNFRNDIFELKNQINELKKVEPDKILSQDDNEEIRELKKKIVSLNSETDQKEVPEEMEKDLKDAKLALTEAQETEAAVKSAESSRVRIRELEDRKIEISNEFNDLEKILDLIIDYNRQVAEKTEEIVNKMFDGDVTFRMFALQENGDFKPTCDILMNGKPYETALSTGEQIQSGLHIINTMSRHFNYYAPIFIENAESVSVIPEMECQTIELHHDRDIENLTQDSVE